MLECGFQSTIFKVLASLKSKEPSVDKIEIHVRHGKVAEGMVDDGFREQCLWHGRYIVPEGLAVRVVRWDEVTFGDWLHDRYLLTDIGGVEIAGGWRAGRSTDTTRISLLGKDVNDELFRRFSLNSTAYKQVDEPPICIQP
ncbi:hypothetical protein FJY68_02720 [candidate division WOR-3 bacterium]|uniref:Uncharacterized protein n=1 Tax=candidate division WOR-3 bacterium TaxID=2052148 RepID=A0A938BSJ4_UNCW3|nr:hypothetical protein [candidate division WOR-3 bacterium]